VAKARTAFGKIKGFLKASLLWTAAQHGANAPGFRCEFREAQDGRGNVAHGEGGEISTPSSAWTAT
jgi:hypothetical protein